MTRRILALVLVSLLVGCGTYRITYRFPSNEAVAEKHPLRKKHSHGIGLIGGGAYFFFLHQMFPALIDYTGVRSVPRHCEHGVYQVQHYSDFGQNTLAALISWLVLINAWHPSNVDWLCVEEPAQDVLQSGAPVVEEPGSTGDTAPEDSAP
jgi:hypothetical protein